MNQPQGQTSFPWNQLWNLPLPPRIKLFLWKIVDNCLPMATFLAKRHIQVPTTCRFYQQVEEDETHLFFIVIL